MNKEYFNAIKLVDYMFFYVSIERYKGPDTYLNLINIILMMDMYVEYAEKL